MPGGGNGAVTAGCLIPDAFTHELSSVYSLVYPYDATWRVPLGTNGIKSGALPKWLWLSQRTNDDAAGSYAVHVVVPGLKVSANGSVLVSPLSEPVWYSPSWTSNVPASNKPR